MSPDAPAPDESPTVRLPPPGGVADLMRGLLAEDEPALPGTASPEDVTVKLAARPESASPAKLSGPLEPGVRIGNYVLKERLGQGGFGTVWRAEQVEPFKRDVALKIILHGMDTEEVIARFEAEKKLLAKMDHPNIASVFDAGATDSGRPYFVMELVKGPDGPGLPITKYCDEKRLAIRERVELFIPVCQAVQHAHMKQVLHRDLKPTNILVAEVDGVAVPKIIDFGIAKAMSPDDDELLATRLRTAADMVVGTLQYMSPEQAGAVQDIDTRSDVYTLGVILYEMLVGEPPIGREDVKKAVFDVLRMIRDATPPRRPSTRWLTATDAQKQAAPATHRADPRRLSLQIQGDLDWIVLKALEKDRTRRYSAAMELAEDLSRFLRHEPVSAGPPSAGYRFKKMILRHKAAFAAGSAVAAAVMIGGGVAAWQWREAAIARDAEAAQRRTAEQARVVAEDAKQLAETRENEALTARELEAKARQAAEEQKRIAEDQRRLAEAARSQAEKERGIAITARGEAEDLINYMLFDLRDKLEPLNRIALLDDVAKKSEAYFKAQPVDGETDSQRRNRGGMWQNRGQIALAMGRTKEAEAAFREFHRIMAERAQAAPRDRSRQLDLAIADGRMSLVHEQAGRLAAAAEAANAEHEIVRHLAAAPEAAGDAGLQRHLAVTLERLGDLALRQERGPEAAERYAEAHRLLRALHQRDARDVMTRRALATITERIADQRLSAGDAAGAEAAWTEEIAIFDGLLDPAAADATLRRALAVALGKRAAALQGQRKLDEARRDLQRALEIATALSSADPGNLQALRDLSLMHEQLAQLLAAQGRPAEALTHWRRGLEVAETLADADPANARWQVDLAVSRWNLAQALLRDGSRASTTEAARHFRDGRETLAKLGDKQALDAAAAAWLSSFDNAIAETARLLK